MPSHHGFSCQRALSLPEVPPRGAEKPCWVQQKIFWMRKRSFVRGKRLFGISKDFSGEGLDLFQASKRPRRESNPKQDGLARTILVQKVGSFEQKVFCFDQMTFSALKRPLGESERSFSENSKQSGRLILDESWPDPYIGFRFRAILQRGMRNRLVGSLTIDSRRRGTERTGALRFPGIAVRHSRTPGSTSAAEPIRVSWSRTSAKRS
jgi:hypothetical protein